jgi:mono/diheme cytochrome c family protein
LTSRQSCRLRVQTPASSSKTLPPNNAAAPYAYDAAAAKALFNGEAPTRDAQIHVDRCAGCHRTDGKGSGVPIAGRQFRAADR